MRQNVQNVCCEPDGIDDTVMILSQMYTAVEYI